MAEETRFKIWTVVQGVVGGMVVAGLLALAGAVGTMWRGFIEHDIFIRQFTEFKEDGNRYTESDGQAERDARITADVTLKSNVDSMLENQNMGWSELRKHIELPSHRGAVYRFDDIEEDIEELKDHCKIKHNGNGR